MGAVGITGRGSCLCLHCGVPESRYPRLCSPSSGFHALQPLAHSRKLSQLVPKSLPGLRCRGCGTQEPDGTAEGERKLDHESRFAAVRATFEVLVWAERPVPRLRCISTQDSGFTTGFQRRLSFNCRGSNA